MSETQKYDPAWGELIPPPIEHLSDAKKAEFWRNSTTKQRLREVQRLRRLEWGPSADGRMDKSKLEVVNVATGDVTVIFTPNKQL